MVPNKQPPQVVVVMVPFQAKGHIDQLLYLAHKIVSQNIPVHYVGASSYNGQAIERVHGWDPKSISNIHFHVHETQPIRNETNHSLPLCYVSSISLRKAVTALVQHLSRVAKKVIVIHDSLLASVAQDVNKIENVEDYTFHSASVFSVSSFQWCQAGKPLPESPFFPPIPSDSVCFLPGVNDFRGAHGGVIKPSDGNIYNSSREIERPYLQFLENIPGGEKKHWALGPLHPLSNSLIENHDSMGGSRKRHSCMEWLDKQEANSVIYVSFGTICIFTEEQIEQIAIGLEQSKKKFIWVLRGADKDVVCYGNEAKRHDLPNVYEERIKGVGLIVRDWAPQLSIQSHPSTGGFMSHCGWNSCMESLSMGVPIATWPLPSCMESLSMGVPIATWPLHSDQPKNSVLITQVLKVGLVVKDWSKRNELVTAAMIENVVRCLMDTKEGDEMRKRAMKIKHDIIRSMEKNGNSRMEMFSFLSRIKLN